MEEGLDKLSEMKIYLEDILDEIFNLRLGVVDYWRYIGNLVYFILEWGYLFGGEVG